MEAGRHVEVASRGEGEGVAARAHFGLRHQLHRLVLPRIQESY